MSLAHKVYPKREAKIWAVSYDSKRDAFRVAMEDGQVFLLLRPIPEDDQSEILETYLEGDGEVFTVLQSSGNEFSMPWDVIEPLAKGKMEPTNLDLGKRIGERVKTLRKGRGFTQEQLAKAAEMKRPNLARLEAGLHVPSLLVVERLALALNVPLSDLVKR